MANEEDPEQVVDFPLVPIGTVEQGRNAGYWRCLVGVGLDSDSCIMSHAQQVVDNLESLVSGGEVDTGNRADLSELGGRVV